MANSVDRRVLEMRFDNKDFEKGIGETMISLETLQRALQMQEGSQGMEKAKKGLFGLGKAAKSVDTNNIADNVEKISGRFSNLGIVGTSILQSVGYRIAELGFTLKNKLLAPLNIIKQKGLSRALDIEQAQFQIKGLGLDVEEVMKNANDAVSGTAYGLNEAAKAASVLGASGIKAGDEMTAVLTSIAGAAAMTGRSYADIADIYSTVASNGKLMTQQLRQFSASGLNVSAVLAKAFNKTEEEINDMVSKGEISFKEFSEAMMSFGEHAKAANDTFSGSLSNMKAALGRIGASFYQPMLVHARDIFNALTPAIDNVHNALKPLIKFIDGVAADATDKFVEKVNGITKAFDVVNKIGTFKFGDEWTKWTTIIGTSDEKLKITGDHISALGDKSGDAYKKLAKHFNKSEDEIKKMVNTGKISYKDFAAATKNTIKLTSNDLNKLMDKGVPALDILSRGLGKTTEEVVKMANEGKLSFADFAKASSSVKITEQDIRDLSAKGVPAISILAKAFDKTEDDIQKMVKNGEISFAQFGEAIQKYVKGSLGDGTTSVKDMALALGGPFAGNMGYFTDIVKAGKDVVDLFKDAFVNLGDVLSGGKGTSALGAIAHTLLAITAWFARATSNAIEFGRTSGAFKKLKDILLNINDFIVKLIDVLWARSEGISNSLSGIMSSFGSFLAKIAGVATKVIGGLANGSLKVVEVLADAVSKVFSSISKSVGSGDDIFAKFTQGLGNFLTLLASGGLVTALGAASRTFAQFFTMFAKNGILGGAMAGGTLSNWNGTMFQLKKTLEVYQKTLRAGALVAIALAIFVLASAVAKLSEIKTKQLFTAIVAIGALFAELTIASNSMKGGSTKGLISLTLAVAILSSSVKKLGELNPAQALQGVAAIGVLFQELGLMMKKINSMQPASMLKAATALVLFSVAIRQLVKPVIKLGELDIKSLAQGLISVAVMMGILIGAIKLISMIDTSGIVKAAATMILFGIAMDLLVLPVKVLGGMDLKSLAKGIGSIVVLLLALTGTAFLLSKIDTGKLFTAGIVMAAMAKALLMLLPVMVVLGSMTVGGLAKGLLSIALLLAELAIAVNLMNGALLGAAAMIVVAGALSILAPALALMASISLGGMLKALLGLAGVIIIVAGASALLAPVIPLMIAFGAAMSVFGIGILGIGAGMMLLAAAFTTGTTAIINGIKTIISFIPMLAEAIAEAILVIINKFVEAAPTIQAAIAAFVDIMLQVLTDAMPRIVDAGIQLIIHLLTGIRNNIGQIVNLAVDIVVNFINGIGSRLGDVIDAGWNLIINFITGMTNAIDKNGPILKDAITDLILACAQQTASMIPFFGDSAAKSISEYRKQLKKGGEGAKKDAKKTGKDVGKNLKIDSKDTKKSMDDYAKSVEKGSKSANKSAKKVADESAKGLKIKSQRSNGENAVKGITSGMDAQIPALRRKSNEVARIVDETIRKKNEIKSPSRRLARTGKYLMQGLMLGIDSLTGEYQKKADNIATTFIASTNSAIGTMSSMSAPSLTGTIARTSDVNLRMDDLSRENDRLANGLAQLTKTLGGMTESMNSRSLNNYITVDGSSDPEAFADDLIRSFRLNARTV